MRLRLADASEVNARIKGKSLKPVCGDRVVAEPIGDEHDWLITSIHERRNELSRPNMRGRVDILAANIDLLIVVAAATPKPDWFIVDRYLSAAENMSASAVVLFNKTDLPLPVGTDDALSVYEKISYATLRCSAENGENVDKLLQLIGRQVAIIVGQSGVGKSSLINRLSPESEQKTAEISSKYREGRHTTVNSVMISLPCGGVVIDSPGVRDYAPALLSNEQVKVGFREIFAQGHNCRFSDCLHLQEPGCAVKDAIEHEQIDSRRYESYRRSLALTERLNRGRY